LQVFNVLSTAGATILGVGYLMPFCYLLWSLKNGPKAGPNPWGAKGLEWQAASPPPTFNFEETPVVTERAYNYDGSIPFPEAGEGITGKGRGHGI
jgi:cytochrome c oxidase subunit I